MTALARTFRWMALAGAVSLALACRTQMPSSPVELAVAFEQALANDDPDAAYGLLAPELQAEIEREAYRIRWRELASERAAMLAAMQVAPEPAFSVSARTRYRNRVELVWTELGKDFVIVDGLPIIPDTTTPLRTLHALVAALRRLEPGPLAPLVEDAVLQRALAGWRDQADAIEAALRTDDALQIDEAAGTAVLLLAPGRAVMLERDGDRNRNEVSRWQVTRLP